MGEKRDYSINRGDHPTRPWRIIEPTNPMTLNNDGAVHISDFVDHEYDYVNNGPADGDEEADDNGEAGNEKDSRHYGNEEQDKDDIESRNNDHDAEQMKKNPGRHVAAQYSESESSRNIAI